MNMNLIPEKWGMKMNSNLKGRGTIGSRGRSRSLELGVGAVILVLMAFWAAARIHAVGGAVSVTATMSGFSSSIVKVGVPVTSTLTGTAGSNYNPPVPPADEGALTMTYTWSDTVEYKAVWIDPTTGLPGAYGSPPANSYTAAIAPNPSVTVPTSVLTFTPLIAGYWAVSVTCSLSVVDNNNQQLTWGGSATAGPQDLTSYTLDISYGGNVVTNQTQNVSVGEQIPVTAVYGPSDMTLQWNVSGSIIANYAPKAGQTFQQSAVITPVSSTALTQPALTYFWMDTDSGQTANEKIGLTGTLPGGTSPPAVNTTFNVYRPVPSFSTQYLGAIALDYGYKVLPGLLVLHDGEEAGTNNDPGIEFYFYIPPSQFGDALNLSTVQTCDLLTVTTDQYDQNTQSVITFEYSIPNNAVPAPALDTSFPYWNSYPNNSAGGTIFNEYCYDAPGYPVDPRPQGPASAQVIGLHTR